MDWKNRLKVGSIVLIVWRDATSYDSWEDPGFSVELAEIHSAGYVYDFDFDRVTLCLNKDMTNGGASCFMSIPYGMVESIKTLKKV